MALRLSRHFAAFIAASVVAIPVCAAAQEAPPSKDAEPPNPLSFTFELDAAPTIGRSLQPDANNDLLDESEYSAKFQIKHDAGLFAITLEPAIAYSPDYYSDQQATSSLGFKAGISGKRTVSWDKGVLKGPEVSTKWYANYQLAANYSDLIETRQSTDQVIKAGIAIESRSYVLYDEPDVAAIPGCRKAGCPGPGIAVTPELAFVASTDPSRRRVTPTVTLGFNAPLNATSIYLTAKTEWRMFSSALTPDGSKRRDVRLTVDAGIHVGPLLGASWPSAASLTIGARYVRNWSNDPTMRTENGYFVPGAALTFKSR